MRPAAGVIILANRAQDRAACGLAKPGKERVEGREFRAALFDLRRATVCEQSSTH
jgi:hypothetical protein